MTQLSVIVPTYHEVENLRELCERIHKAVQSAGLSTEILIVDDNSQDGTIELCAELARQLPVRLITRTTDRGLSSAVVCGMQAAEGETLLVMDADLSHPPEKIPEMVAQLNTGDTDFVLGSRYVPGAATDAEWTFYRRMNSGVATLMAWPLTNVKDPMAGFFAIRRGLFTKHSGELNPVGYKIALEILVKCGCQNVREIPISFVDREKGQSKLTMQVQLQYLKHLRRLYEFRFPVLARFFQFSLVGASGLVVDLTCYSAALAVFAAGPARAIAIWVAMTWNFALNRNVTFHDAKAQGFFSQYLQFCASCLVGAVVNWSTSMALVASSTWFAQNALWSAIPGVAAGIVFNFALCHGVVFRRRSKAVVHSAAENAAAHSPVDSQSRRAA